MSDKPAFLHRPGDLPRKELAERANETILRNGGPQKAEVHFKFTCIHCGERCSFVEPNMLYEFGECGKCGKQTQVTVGGFALHLKL